MIQLVIQLRLLMIVRKQLVLKGLRDEDFATIRIDVNSDSWTCPSLDRRFSLLEYYVKEKPSSSSAHNRHYFLHSIFARFLRKHALGTSFFSTDIETFNPIELGVGVISTPIEAKPHPVPACSGDDQPEKLGRRITEAKINSILIWMFLPLLLVGVVASMVGYIGCFSAVQGSSSSKEALIRLALEAALSVLRIILWGINLECDDAPSLEFTFELDVHAPFPTCTMTAEEIERDKVLRAPEFLQSITSYGELLKQFSHPTLSLYYTLTRNNIPGIGRRGPSTARVLYITIFDHTERTTRVYTCQDSPCFYSAYSIILDLEHGVV